MTNNVIYLGKTKITVIVPRKIHLFSIIKAVTHEVIFINETENSTDYDD